MAKDSRSRYLKRKAKLVKRAAETGRGMVKPYGGTKYQQDEWESLVFATERAIYETILMTDRRLTNDAVKAAFTKLVLRMRQGLSPTLTPDDVQPTLVIGDESEFLVWKIRDSWTRFFDEQRQVAVEDLIGVLRTLLHSIVAHQWNSGRDLGYVAFLQGFFENEGAMEKNWIILPGFEDEDEDDVEGFRRNL